MDSEERQMEGMAGTEVLPRLLSAARRAAADSGRGNHPPLGAGAIGAGSDLPSDQPAEDLQDRGIVAAACVGRTCHRLKRLCLSMISAQTLRVCRGKPVSTFPDHASHASI